MKPNGMFCTLLAIAALIACAPAQPEIEEAPPVPTGLENGSFTANLNGFDIHYEVHGQGPVLMALTNSWGLSLEGLRALYLPLEEKLTMVYFDPRGMGESAPIVEESDMGMAAVRADFDALRQHLGLQTVNAIGWSNGAMNLISLASEYPETLDAAVFVHGIASFGQEDFEQMAAEMPEMMQRYAQFQAEVHDPELDDAERTAMLRSIWFDEWFPLATFEPENAPEMFEKLFADAEFNWAFSDYTTRENPTFDARDQLPAITARCLVIAGVHDTTRVEKVRELHEGLADSEFLIFEESGHFSPAEEPEAFKKAIFMFLGVE